MKWNQVWNELRGDFHRVGQWLILALVLAASLHFIPWGGLPGDLLSVVGFVLVLLVLLVHLLRRIALGGVQLISTARRAADDPIGAAIVFAATVGFMAALLWAGVTLFVRPANAESDLPRGLPANAYQNLPIVMDAKMQFWPDHPMPSALAAQVEQETCITLKSKHCWSERAENRNAKNNNERGVGLGQCTRTDKFDCMAEAKRRYGALLAGWSWDKPYNPMYQSRALVLQDKGLYSSIRGVDDRREQLAMMLVGYNAGPGTLAKRRALCSTKSGCDPARWFGHAELADGKSAKNLPGYSRTAADIAREYPHNILIVRQPRYAFLDRG
ncbi:hypothetical protein HQ393_04865 [Chitinibacter bivalviorum]|uniref:Transglycosylase SLT domain-containing protein n=1 Tax=Chitinibacter bivalviorum TaxID=2739434 RepID=A0A7H9BGB3_9NEIS|nr:hypothetical protein [Chitinibacter bivalviorum]QLG87637.1 hypothetical protein HQ393_04865 [Chitinibacter bivalviorum]